MAELRHWAAVWLQPCGSLTVARQASLKTFPFARNGAANGDPAGRFAGRTSHFVPGSARPGPSARTLGGEVK